MGSMTKCITRHTLPCYGHQQCGRQGCQQENSRQEWGLRRLVRAFQDGLIKGNMMSFRHRLRLKIREKIPHGVGKTKEETGKVSGGPSSEGEIQHGLVKGNMMSFRHRLRLKIREKILHDIGKTKEAIRNEGRQQSQQDQSQS